MSDLSTVNTLIDLHNFLLTFSVNNCLVVRNEDSLVFHQPGQSVYLSQDLLKYMVIPDNFNKGILTVSDLEDLLNVLSEILKKGLVPTKISLAIITPVNYGFCLYSHRHDKNLQGIGAVPIYEFKLVSYSSKSCWFHLIKIFNSEFRRICKVIKKSNEVI